MAVGPDLSQLSISQLHELTGRERRWIKKRLADRAVTPVSRTGRSMLYTARDALDAIYDRDGLDPATEQARLHQARRELAELDLAEKRREFVPAAQVEAAWTKVATMIRAKILAVAVKVAQVLAATSDPKECHAIVEEALHEALEALAETEIDPPPGE